MDHLTLRKGLKKRKPSFISQDSYKQIKVKESWRKPKGKQAKVRYGFRGNMKMPSPGWKSPRDVRGLHFTGKHEVRVGNVADLAKVNKETSGALIISGVGIKKRLEILKACIEKGITVLNYADPKAEITQMEQDLVAKKKDKADRETQKTKKDTKKDKEKEKELADKVSDEEKKDKEDAEKAKVLTSKDAVRA
jgi:large subunit ribosomal protein L32e